MQKNQPEMRALIRRKYKPMTANHKVRKALESGIDTLVRIHTVDAPGTAYELGDQVIVAQFKNSQDEFYLAGTGKRYREVTKQYADSLIANCPGNGGSLEGVMYGRSGPPETTTDISRLGPEVPKTESDCYPVKPTGSFC